MPGAGAPQELDVAVSEAARPDLDAAIDNALAARGIEVPTAIA